MICYNTIKLKPGHQFTTLALYDDSSKETVRTAYDRGIREFAGYSNQATWISSDCKFINLDNAIELSNRFQNKQPQRMYGVTGTNGKTSVCHFLHQIWSQLGFHNMSVGTLGQVSSPPIELDKKFRRHPIYLRNFFAEASDAGYDRAAVEFFSLQLKQKRMESYKIRAAAFTNLTEDHLEYHTDIEEYFQCKRRLFSEILDKDAPSVIYFNNPFSHRLPKNSSTLFYGDNTALPLSYDQNYLNIFEKKFPIDQLSIEKMPIYLENLLCAIGLAIVDDIPVDKILETLAQIEMPPGRLKKIFTSEDRKNFYVDYAHNVDGYQKTLDHLRKVTPGKVHVIFSAWHNVKSESIAVAETIHQLADAAIITSEDDLNDKLIPDLQVGHPTAEVRPVRREALELAIQLSNPGDTILMAGGYDQFFDPSTKNKYRDDQLIVETMTNLQGAQ